MKPSERIKQILKTPDAHGFYTSETGAILDYLDEEYEKKVVEKRKREETGERF